MKERVSVFLAALILGLLFLPFFTVGYVVYAATNVTTPEGYSIHELQPGDKFALPSGEEATYLGELSGGRYGCKVELGPVKYIPSTQTRIEAGWYWDAEKKQWLSHPNMFDSFVQGRKVTIVNDGKSLSWTPQLLIGDKEVKPTFDEAILLPTDPINSHYQGNTLEWDYGNGIERRLRIIEGVQQEFFIIPSDPGADVQVIDLSKSKDAGFIWERSPAAWDADYGLIDISSSKVVTAAEFAREDIEYPITIDPTTTYTTSASDGTLNHFSGQTADAATAWNVAHDAASATNAWTSSGILDVGVEATYIPSWGYTAQIDRAALYFDTSELPNDATISSATLSIYIYSKQNELGNWTLQLQTGGATYPRVPLVTADYNYSYYSGNLGTLAYASMSTGAYNTVTFGTSYVSKTGTTKFVLREKEHDVDDSQPTFGSGDDRYNELRFYSYEQGDGYWPQLEVIYVATSAPTIVIGAATGISTTGATLHAYLSDDGGEASSIKFLYDVDSGAPYSYDTGWLAINYTTGQNPSKAVTGLNTNDVYYVMAQAQNSAGATNSTENSFTTLSSLNPPTGFSAVPRSSTSASFAWIKGVGSSYTLVRYKTGGYPSSESDGTLACNITGGSYALEGLSSGQTIYVRSWGWDGGSFSTAYTDEMVTTFAGLVPGVTEGEGPLRTPAVPSNFFGPADYTGLANLPVYTVFNSNFDDSDIPRTQGWLILLFGISTAVGVAVAAFTKNPMVGVGAMLFVLAYGAEVRLLPGVYFALIAILGVSVMYVLSREGG